MSRQLSVSAAFSILAMVSYVLFGGDSVRQPIGYDSAPIASTVQISAPELPGPSALLSSLR